MSGRDQLSLWRAALLVLAPLALRLGVWRELRRSPFFDVLFIDARIYHEMAEQMAAGTLVANTPYWQPPFYPMLLSLIYRVTGPNPDVARGVGIVLGTLACVLVFLIARRFFGPRAGWVAWGIVSLSGPMMFFDLQLLNVTLGITLALGCLWLWSGGESLTTGRALPSSAVAGGAAHRVKAAVDKEGPSVPSEVSRQVAAGLLGGLAAITIGNMLLFVGAIVVWTLFRRVNRTALYWSALAAFVVAALLPPAVISLQNQRLSGEWIGISYNSGINYWIGNNPEYDRTVEVRPGRTWIAWTDEPRREGRTGFRAQSDYFFEKSASWFAADPGRGARLQLRKLGLFLRGDEIMRNQEIYPFRDDSRILRLLLWSRGIAIPFGLLFPLAAAATISLWFERRRFSSRWRILPFLVLLYSLSVVAFFVTARYRLPVVPLLAILAGGGVTFWIERFVRGPWGSLVAPSIVGLLCLFFCARGTPHAAADFNSDAYYDLGVHLQSYGDFDGARLRYEQALERNPQNHEAMNNLAGLAMRGGDLATAGRNLRGVLLAFPDDVRARYNLGLVYLDEGKPYDAGWQLHRVLQARPDHPKAKAKLAQAEAMSRQLEATWAVQSEDAIVATLQGAFRANPTNGFLHQRLRSMLVERGRDAEVAEVDRLFAAARENEPEG